MPPPSLTDAILDSIVHDRYSIELIDPSKDISMRGYGLDPSEKQYPSVEDILDLAIDFTLSLTSFLDGSYDFTQIEIDNLAITLDNLVHSVITCFLQSTAPSAAK